MWGEMAACCFSSCGWRVTTQSASPHACGSVRWVGVPHTLTRAAFCSLRVRWRRGRQLDVNQIACGSAASTGTRRCGSRSRQRCCEHAKERLDVNTQLRGRLNVQDAFITCCSLRLLCRNLPAARRVSAARGKRRLFAAAVSDKDSEARAHVLNTPSLT